MFVFLHISVSLYLYFIFILDFINIIYLFNTLKYVFLICKPIFFTIYKYKLQILFLQFLNWMNFYYFIFLFKYLALNFIDK